MAVIPSVAAITPAKALHLIASLRGIWMSPTVRELYNTEFSVSSSLMIPYLQSPLRLDRSRPEPVDELVPARLGVLHLRGRLPRRGRVRAERHDAAEQRRGGAAQGQEVGPDRADQHGHDQQRSAGDRDLGDQDDLAAALDRLGQRLDACLEPRDLARQ